MSALRTSYSDALYYIQPPPPSGTWSVPLAQPICAIPHLHLKTALEKIEKGNELAGTPTFCTALVFYVHQNPRQDLY